MVRKPDWLACPYCESAEIDLIQYKRPGEYLSLTLTCQACLSTGEVRVDFN